MCTNVLTLIWNTLGIQVYKSTHANWKMRPCARSIQLPWFQQNYAWFSTAYLMTHVGVPMRFSPSKHQPTQLLYVFVWPFPALENHLPYKIPRHERALYNPSLQIQKWILRLFAWKNMFSCLTVWTSLQALQKKCMHMCIFIEWLQE